MEKSTVCVCKNVLSCFLLITEEQLLSLLYREQSWEKPVKSGAIHLDLFEQRMTFDPRAKAIFTYSQPECICSVTA